MVIIYLEKMEGTNTSYILCRIIKNNKKRKKRREVYVVTLDTLVGTSG